MKLLLLTIIGNITSDKQAQNKAPALASILEIKKAVYDELYKALSELEIDGVIETGETLNDRWVILKK